MGDTPIPARTNRRGLRRVAGLTALGLIAAVTVSGCTANEAFFFDLPTPASQEAEIVKSLWEGSWIAAWAVGVLTWGLMIFAAIAYRRRRNRPDVPRQTRYNIPIEVLYTVAPLIMILGLFTFTARDQTAILSMENDQSETINVVGFRWSWAFNYLDEDVYSVGTPQQLPELVVPVNEKIRFELTSPDVIHSFWVVDWLFKMDVVPGRLNQFEVTPTTTGEFIGRCAELCGTQHALMLFKVRVVERADYDAYIQDLRDQGQTGKLGTGEINGMKDRTREPLL